MTGNSANDRGSGGNSRLGIYSIQWAANIGLAHSGTF